MVNNVPTSTRRSCQAAVIEATDCKELLLGSEVQGSIDGVFSAVGLGEAAFAADPPSRSVS